MNSVLFDTSDNYLKIALFDAFNEIESKPTIFFEWTDVKEFDQFYLYWDRLMVEAKITTKDLKSIFVNRGPGSFMGVRLSVMVAKTLSYLNHASLYGFNTFDMMSTGLNNIINDHQLIYVLIKPLFNSNYTFTLIQAENGKCKRLIPISKLEGTDVFFKELLADKSKLLGYLKDLKWGDKISGIETVKAEQLITVGYREVLENNKEGEGYNWDIEIDYNRLLLEKFIINLKNDSTSISTINQFTPFELTPIYV